MTGVELEGYAHVLRARAPRVAERCERGGQEASQSLLLPHRLSGLGHARGLEGKHRRRATLSLTHHVVGHRHGHRAWESAAGTNIFGFGSIDTTVHPNSSADGQNVVQFGNAGGGGTVAVTYIWGSRRAAIFEWDMIFGNDWDWSDGGSSTTFDFLGVATHEIGHAAGLDHPAITCTQETMYAYVNFGETHQRSLNDGDKAGINALY